MKNRIENDNIKKLKMILNIFVRKKRKEKINYFTFFILLRVHRVTSSFVINKLADFHDNESQYVVAMLMLVGRFFLGFCFYLISSILLLFFFLLLHTVIEIE